MDGSLRDLLEKRKRLSQKEAVVWTYKIVKDYQFLFKMHKLHRDLKPENILYIVLENGDFVFKIADFGLAKTA